MTTINTSINAPSLTQTLMKNGVGNTKEEESANTTQQATSQPVQTQTKTAVKATGEAGLSSDAMQALLESQGDLVLSDASVAATESESTGANQSVPSSGGGAVVSSSAEDSSTTVESEEKRTNQNGSVTTTTTYEDGHKTEKTSAPDPNKASVAYTQQQKQQKEGTSDPKTDPMAAGFDA